MPAFAALVLKNNAATNVTFNPLTIDTTTGVASYATSEAVWDAKSTCTVSSSTPSAKSSRAKQRVRVTVPIMDAVDTTKKIDEVIIDVQCNYSRLSTSGHRNDARAFADSALQHAIATAFATSYEGIY